MQVCQLVNQLEPGGAQNLVLELVRHSDEISYTVCFLEDDSTMANEFCDAGAEVVPLNGAFKFDPRAVRRFYDVVSEGSFDVVHTHLAYSQIVGRITARLASWTPVVSTHHTVPWNNHPVTGNLERLTRRLDAYTIAVSNGVRDGYASERLDRLWANDTQWRTILNGVDVAEFYRQAKTTDVAALRSQWDVEDKLVFVNVSRYVPQKGQLDLIKAMDILINDIPKAHLFIIGYGPLHNKLKHAVHERGLSDSITITGQIRPIHGYYGFADAFVSSSVIEGLPLTHLEAMSAELPVIATDIPGVREVVDEGQTGRLIPPGRPDLLADAMRSLASAELRTELGKRGHEVAAARFNIDNALEQYVDLYHSLTS
jgi:glycosyltransferase involved in cell wall biosynthesis